MATKTIAILMGIMGALALATAAARAAGDRLFISYREAERLALANSHRIQSQGHVVSAAGETERAQRARRLPQFSFGAESEFVSKVGRISVAALGITQQVGEHINWAVGPAVSAVLWDTGHIMNRAKSLQRITSAEENELDWDKRQVLLGARGAYIGVQLAKEQVRLVAEALKLARAQYAYVADRASAGTADRFDLTVAHQEMTDRQKDLEQAQGELAVAKRDLLGALGLDEEMDGADAVEVEPIPKVLGAMLPKADAEVEIAEHPQVRALADRQASAELAAKSAIVQYYPAVNLKGAATFEYPNLGQSEVIQQNRATLHLSVPILDWGMIAKQARSHRFEAKAANEEMRQTIVDLTRALADVRSRIETSKKLRVATARAARDAAEVARLSFESYQIGRIIFLDVQRANVRALSAKVEQARTDAGLGLEIARLMALAETEGDFQ